MLLGSLSLFFFVENIPYYLETKRALVLVSRLNEKMREAR